MSWDDFKRGQGSPLSEPPKKEEVKRLNGPVRRPDGREKRATGRTQQFNPRVSENFIEQFNMARKAEEKRTGEKITQGYMLELLLSIYQRAQGEELRPFGLSAHAYEGAQAIADHMGWPLSVVLEDAIAARYKQFNFAKEAETTKR